MLLMLVSSQNNEAERLTIILCLVALEKRYSLGPLGWPIVAQDHRHAESIPQSYQQCPGGRLASYPRYLKTTD
jgi:hypothetical protein